MMKPPTRLILGSLAAATVTAFAVILLWSSPQSPDDNNPPMRIASYYWPGMYWVDIARHKGWFEEAGLSAEFPNVNADYYGALEELSNGSLDTLTVWMFDLIKRRQQGSPLVMVLATDESDGSEALIASPGIESVQQLKNRRVGVALGTALVYELDAMLSRFGLDLDDVVLVDIAPEKAAEELATQNVAAVITWEPFSSAAEAAGGTKLYDSSSLPGLVVAGMTFRESFIKQRPEDIQRMVRVWRRATDYISNHRAEAFTIVAEAQGVTVEEVASFAETTAILGLRDNIKAFTYASGLESLFGSARKINRFLIKREPDITDSVDGVSVLDGQFVRELVRERSR
jgi:NitT/TauT family transport system substrate-binding protein